MEWPGIDVDPERGKNLLRHDTPHASLSWRLPGIVGDSPYWVDKPLDAVIERTPTKRLCTMEDVVDATVFLLENRSVNGVNLYVDSGWLLM